MQVSVIQALEELRCFKHVLPLPAGSQTDTGGVHAPEFAAVTATVGHGTGEPVPSETLSVMDPTAEPAIDMERTAPVCGCVPEKVNVVPFPPPAVKVTVSPTAIDVLEAVQDKAVVPPPQTFGIPPLPQV